MTFLNVIQLQKCLIVKLKLSTTGNTDAYMGCPFLTILEALPYCRSEIIGAPLNLEEDEPVNLLKRAYATSYHLTLLWQSTQGTLNRDKQPLVTDEPVKLEK